MTKQPIPSEYVEACEFHNWLVGQGIDHFHTPNETGGNQARGAMNKRIGVSSGIPDFFIFVPRGDGTFINVVIELKRQDGGSGLSKTQREWLVKLARYGFEAYKCDGAREAIDTIMSIRNGKNLIANDFSTESTEVDSPF